jgi:hypothetical protein
MLKQYFKSPGKWTDLSWYGNCPNGEKSFGLFGYKTLFVSQKT